MMHTAPSALDYVDEIVAEMGARRLVVFLDYDGTLTPIVSRPEKAVLSNSTRQTLQTLAVQAPVTILSGRAASRGAAARRQKGVRAPAGHRLEQRQSPALAAGDDWLGVTGNLPHLRWRRSHGRRCVSCD